VEWTTLKCRGQECVELWPSWVGAQLKKHRDKFTFTMHNNPLSPPLRPDRLWGPPNLQSNGNQGALSLGIQRLGREADYSPPSSAEIRNAWGYTSTPISFSWRCASLSTGTFTGPVDEWVTLQCSTLKVPCSNLGLGTGYSD